MTWLMLRSCWPECQEASAPRSWAWWFQFQRRMAWLMVRLLLSLLLPWLASLRQWTLARPCTTASTQPSSRLPRARVPSLPSWSASLRMATEQLRALFMDGLAIRGISQSGMCGWKWGDDGVFWKKMSMRLLFSSCQLLGRRPIVQSYVSLECGRFHSFKTSCLCWQFWILGITQICQQHCPNIQNASFRFFSFLLFGGSLTWYPNGRLPEFVLTDPSINEVQIGLSICISMWFCLDFQSTLARSTAFWEARGVDFQHKRMHGPPSIFWLTIVRSRYFESLWKGRELEGGG